MLSRAQNQIRDCALCRSSASLTAVAWTWINTKHNDKLLHPFLLLVTARREK